MNVPPNQFLEVQFLEVADRAVVRLYLSSVVRAETNLENISSCRAGTESYVMFECFPPKLVVLIICVCKGYIELYSLKIILYSNNRLFGEVAAARARGDPAVLEELRVERRSCQHPVRGLLARRAFAAESCRLMAQKRAR